MNPKVLIATTARWFPTARLALALANAGFVVDAVCPSHHPLAKVDRVGRLYDYRNLNPLGSFFDAISASKPELVLPGDDLAAQHLHAMFEEGLRTGRTEVSQLIERSLGSSQNFAILYARTEFMNLARQEGVRVPDTQVIRSANDLRNWVAQKGLPTVLKTDGSSGGDGVRIMRTLADAERAFRTLQAPPLLARAAKRTLFDRDARLLRPSLLRVRSAVNAQVFVDGREANSAVACWNGEVLASLHFEVIHKVAASGHATVVRLIDHAEMSEAVKRIVRRLKLSGVHGFDFMLEASGAGAYLIEINPRTTQVGHLTLGLGSDLPAALYAAASGKEPSAAQKVTDLDTIALFPQEWLRDPSSKFLQSAYHDVPWDQPELIRACVSARRKRRAWDSQQSQLHRFSLAQLPRL